MERKIGDPVPVDALAKAESELSRGYRIMNLPTFRDKENVVIHIYHPSLEDQERISSVYAETFNRILVGNSGLTTKKKFLEILEQKGIWTQADENKIENYRQEANQYEINILQEKRRKKPNEKYCAAQQKLYDDVRMNILELISIKESYLNQTIDYKAEEASKMVQLMLCVKYEDGTPVWPTLDDLKKERGREALDIILEATYFWSGLSREVLSMLPDSLYQGAASEQSQEQPDGKEDTQLQ